MEVLMPKYLLYVPDIYCMPCDFLLCINVFKHSSSFVCLLKVILNLLYNFIHPIYRTLCIAVLRNRIRLFLNGFSFF